MNRRRLLTLVLAAAVVAALVVFGLAGHTRAGRAAPALPTAALGGHPVSVAQLHGRPAFVVFWASWCPPCHREAPAIAAYARRAGARAAVVGVDYDDPETAHARDFVRQYGWSFPSLLDPDGVVGARYGLVGLPTTVLLDAEGHIVATLTGEQSQRTLDRALSSL
jgi:cytochrome c biogenesis protein CcmG/thiol:disulfide interchange protein DsbE